MPRPPRCPDRRRPSPPEYGSPPLSVGIAEGHADTTEGEATGTQAASLAGVSRPSPDLERASRDPEASRSPGERRGPGGCVGATVGHPTVQICRPWWVGGEPISGRTSKQESLWSCPC